MCWAHVHMNCQEKSNSITDKDVKEEIINDISGIQIMPSPATFDHAVKLFFEKWDDYEVSGVQDFLTHFRNEWINSVNHGWYEGMSDKIPSTDNGLEAANGIIKSIHTLRERRSVSQYLVNATDMIRNWSKDRVVNKPFYTEPKVDSRTWSLAWNFLYKGSPVIKSATVNKGEIEYKNLAIGAKPKRGRNSKAVEGKRKQPEDKK